MSTETHLGQRLAAIRHGRRMSQTQLADAAGVSLGLIRKLEQGQRLSARLETVHALAEALAVPVSDLLGVPGGLPGNAAADVSAVRAAIYDASSDVDPPPLDVLRTQMVDLRDLYWHARYGVLAHELPRHLRAARAALRDATGGPQAREANAVLSESLNIAAEMVTHLAHEDLAHVALMQAMTAAQAAEDPLMIAARQATTAWVLSRQGLWGPAQQLATTAAREIEPILSQAPPEQIGLWGNLLHHGLVALAREGREDEAHELLGLVQAAGHAIGDRAASARYDLTFSRTFAGHSRVQLAQATGKPREALVAAQQVDAPESLPPSIQARYLLNVAWAAAAEWRNEEALAALRSIEQLAPELLVHHGLARSIVEELMPRRHQHRLRGLSTIAEQIGVTG